MRIADFDLIDLTLPTAGLHASQNVRSDQLHLAGDVPLVCEPKVLSARSVLLTIGSMTIVDVSIAHSFVLGAQRPGIPLQCLQRRRDPKNH